MNCLWHNLPRTNLHLWCGVQDSRKVKAIMPAGASSSLIIIDDEKILDTPMDYATVRTPKRTWICLCDRDR